MTQPRTCPRHPDHALLPAGGKRDWCTSGHYHEPLPKVRDDEDRIGALLQREMERR